jgi:hypothetical protein
LLPDELVIDQGSPVEHYRSILLRFVLVLNLRLIFNLKLVPENQLIKFNNFIRDFSSAPFVAIAPSSGALSFFNEPLKQPTGVLTAETITTCYKVFGQIRYGFSRAKVTNFFFKKNRNLR